MALKNSGRVALDQKFQENLKRDNKKSESTKYYLFDILGKIACFREYFDGFSLDNQELPEELKSDSKAKEYFDKGYERAKMLIAQGFTRENYKSFVETNKHR